MNPIRISVVFGVLAIGTAALAQTSAPAPAAGATPSAETAPDQRQGPASMPGRHDGMHRHGGPAQAAGPQGAGPCGPGGGGHMHGGQMHGGQMYGKGAGHEMQHGGHGRHGMHRAAMMRGVDANRDGVVSRTEVLQAQQRQLEMFDRADADRDGQLTRDERRAMRAAMCGSRPAGSGVQGAVEEPAGAIRPRS